MAKPKLPVTTGTSTGIGPLAPERMVDVVVEPEDPDVPTAPNRKLMSTFCAGWAKAALPRNPLMKQNVPIVFIRILPWEYLTRRPALEPGNSYERREIAYGWRTPRK